MIPIKLFTEVRLSRVTLGDKVLIQGNICNIDNRKRAQRLFDKTGDACLILKEGVITEYNSAAVALLQFPNKEALINHPSGDMSPALQPDGQESGAKADGMIAASCDKAPQRFVAVHLKYDGAPITVEVMPDPPHEFLRRARL